MNEEKDMSKTLATFRRLAEAAERVAPWVEIMADPDSGAPKYSSDRVKRDCRAFLEALDALRAALRAEAGGGDALVYVDYCSCIMPQVIGTLTTRCHTCGRELEEHLRRFNSPWAED